MRADDGSQVIGRAPSDSAALKRARSYVSGFCNDVGKPAQHARCPRAQGKCTCACHLPAATNSEGA